MRKNVKAALVALICLVVLLLGIALLPEMGKGEDVLYTVTYSRIPGTDMGVMEFTWLGEEPLTITPEGWYVGGDDGG